MTTPDPAVTVIIPTLGLRERAACLRAAIQSTLDQRGVATIVRVVINESKRDPQVERELRDSVHIALVVRDARGGFDPMLRIYDLRHTNISARSRQENSS